MESSGQVGYKSSSSPFDLSRYRSNLRYKLMSSSTHPPSVPSDSAQEDSTGYFNEGRKVIHPDLLLASLRPRVDLATLQGRASRRVGQYWSSGFPTFSGAQLASQGEILPDVESAELVTNEDSGSKSLEIVLSKLFLLTEPSEYGPEQLLDDDLVKSVHWELGKRFAGVSQEMLNGLADKPDELYETVASWYIGATEALLLPEGIANCNLVSSADTNEFKHPDQNGSIRSLIVRSIPRKDHKLTVLEAQLRWLHDLEYLDEPAISAACGQTRLGLLTARQLGTVMPHEDPTVIYSLRDLYERNDRGGPALESSHMEGVEVETIWRLTRSPQIGLPAILDIYVTGKASFDPISSDHEDLKATEPFEAAGDGQVSSNGDPCPENSSEPKSVGDTACASTLQPRAKFTGYLDHETMRTLAEYIPQAMESYTFDDLVFEIQQLEEGAPCRPDARGNLDTVVSYALFAVAVTDPERNSAWPEGAIEAACKPFSETNLEVRMHLGPDRDTPVEYEKYPVPLEISNNLSSISERWTLERDMWI